METKHILLPSAMFLLPAIIVSIIVSSSIFIVHPTEMAGMRCFGSVSTSIPYGSGTHFKIPFFCDVDKLQVSLDKVDLDTIEVHTIDNQKIIAGISMTYTVPLKAVLHLLYEVGRSGSVDIKSNILPIVKDRASKVFARYNTQDISAKREIIGKEITEEVDLAIEKFFGVQIIDMQINQLSYSRAFEDSNNAAVLKKNEALGEHYKVGLIQEQANQKVATEKGEGDAKEARARGDAAAMLAKSEAEAKSTLVKAQAEAKAIELVATAQSKRLTLAGEAYSKYPTLVYVEILKDFAVKWQGNLPTTVVAPSEGNVLSLLNLKKD